MDIGIRRVFQASLKEPERLFAEIRLRGGCSMGFYSVSGVFSALYSVSGVLVF